MSDPPIEPSYPDPEDDKSEIRHLPQADRYRPITPEEFLKRKV